MRKKALHLRWIKSVKRLAFLGRFERDIKNTLISIATYAKALKSEGANLYSFAEESGAIEIISEALHNTSITEESLRSFWGEGLYTFSDTSNVFQPLVEAFQKTKSNAIDTRAVVVCAANAFESFLSEFAIKNSVSLTGKNGILQKCSALSQYLSKKHRGMIDYIGQIRNAADHGADSDENNQMWTVTVETATLYPCIVAVVIKDIYVRHINGSIEV